MNLVYTSIFNILYLSFNIIYIVIGMNINSRRIDKTTYYYSMVDLIKIIIAKGGEVDAIINSLGGKPEV